MKILIMQTIAPLQNRHHQALTSVIVSLLLISTVQPSLAQEGDTADRALEEIIVSARRYEESLQDAPVAVNVMTADYLEAQGINKVSDVIAFSPGTTFIRFNKLQDEYSMRGSSSQTEGTSGDSSVQTVIDNVVISKDFMKNAAFFDVERVEILRGPQGTAFGRNASAGLVHIITKRPKQEFEASITVGAGSHGSYKVEGFVSGAVSENVAGRVAVHFDTNDGWFEDVLTGRDLAGQENTSIRGSLLFTPSDNLQVYFKAEYNEDDDDAPVRRSPDCSLPQTVFTGPGPPTQHPTFDAPITSFADYTDPCDIWKTAISAGDFPLEREIINLTAEVVWEISDGLTLTSVTGFLDGEASYLLEGQGTPSNILFQNVVGDAQSFTQEFRLDNHAAGDRLAWLAGAYYLDDEHDRFDQNRFYEQPGGPNGRNTNNPLTLDTRDSFGETESVGLFGELNYGFTDKLNGSFGARWSSDDKDYSVSHTAIGWAPKVTGFVDVPNAGAICDFPSGPPTPSDGSGGCPLSGFATPVTTSGDWDDVSVKVSLQYAVSDDIMVYGLYAEGYKTGGFQPEPASTADALIPFNEETSTNYEIGFKGEFGGRFRLNASVYFVEYDDLQLTQFLTVPGGFRAFIANAGSSETTGVELEFVWQATDNFLVTGSYANLDVELKDTVIPTDETGTLTDFSGQRPDNTPEWTGTVIAEYTFPLGGGSSLILRGDWRGRSDVFDGIGELPDRLRPEANVYGARVTWLSADAQWSASVWGKNLSEEEQWLNIGPPQPDTFQHPVSFGEPLTYGATLTLNF